MSSFHEREHERRGRVPSSPRIEDARQPAFINRIREALQPSESIYHQEGLQLINTRLWLQDIFGDQDPNDPNRKTIADVPKEVWEKLYRQSDYIWFMGVYTPSAHSQQHCAQYSHEYRYAIPTLRAEEVQASPFAVPDYSPNPLIARDWEEWDLVRDELHRNGKKVILDFVPNHTAVDHHWVTEHPEYYVQAPEWRYRESPGLYVPVEGEDGVVRYLAHGKDPHFPEWADTLQLNYARPDLQREMKTVLKNLARHADGVRCDMAMLVNPDTFQRTWGYLLSAEERAFLHQHPFWEEAIPELKQDARERGQEFSFIAEAYWDKEYLGQQFDYIYAKDFYDHLQAIVNGQASPLRADGGNNLRDHIRHMMMAYESWGRHYKDVLFTENHDERRAIEIFGVGPSKAAAVLAGLIPNSLFLLNQGQARGNRIRPPMQIGRFPEEPGIDQIREFYDRLITLKRSKFFQKGDWSLAELQDDSPSIVSMKVRYRHQGRTIEGYVCVNFGQTTGSCKLPAIRPESSAVVYDLTNNQTIFNPDQEREGGMYLELLPWQTEIIFVESV